VSGPELMMRESVTHGTGCDSGAHPGPDPKTLGLGQSRAVDQAAVESRE
jgi:hypothetical protein